MGPEFSTSTRISYDEFRNDLHQLVENARACPSFDKIAEFITANDCYLAAEQGLPYQLGHDLTLLSKAITKTAPELAERISTIAMGIVPEGMWDSSQWVDPFVEGLSQYLTDGELNRVLQVSCSWREMSAMALVARKKWNGASLNDLGIRSAEKALDFVRRYGPAFTLLDASAIAFSTDELREFLSHLPNLVELSLMSCGVDDAGAKVLASAETLVGLIVLVLGDNHIGAEGMTAIANSKTLTFLEALELQGNQLGAGVCQAIAVSNNFEKLQYLGLGDNGVGPEGATALANSETLTELLSLELQSNKIGDEGTVVIANSKICRGVESLDLCDNGIGAKGAEALACSPNLTELIGLNLWINNIGDEGAHAIANSAVLTKLQELNVAMNGISDSGFEAIEHFFSDRGITVGNPFCG